MGGRASWQTTSRRFLSRLDFFFFSISFSRVATSGSNKINLNPLVNPIHALSAKLAIPSNPHLPIIPLSCVSSKSSVQSALARRASRTSSQPEPAQTSQRRRANEQGGLTGRRKHLFASEHRVRPCHEAHHLFRLAQSLSSGSEPDNRLGENDPGSRNRSEYSRERYRLNNAVRTPSQSRTQTASRRSFPEVSPEWGPVH